MFYLSKIQNILSSKSLWTQRFRISNCGLISTWCQHHAEKNKPTLDSQAPLWIQTWPFTLKPQESYLTSRKVHVVESWFTASGVNFLKFLHTSPPQQMHLSLHSPSLTASQFWRLLHAWIVHGHSLAACFANRTTEDGVWAEWELSVECRELGEGFRWRNRVDLLLSLALLCTSDSHQQSDELISRGADAPKVRKVSMHKGINGWLFKVVLVSWTWTTAWSLLGVGGWGERV